MKNSVKFTVEFDFAALSAEAQAEWVALVTDAINNEARVTQVEVGA